MSLVKEVIEADVDDHVFIVIYQKDKPTLSIDLSNTHHRRGMTVRVDGTNMLSFYADAESPKKPSGERMARFCPFCGEVIALVSSKSHHCEDNDEKAQARYEQRLDELFNG